MAQAKHTRLQILGCILLASLALTVAQTPPGIAKNPSHSTCKIKKYKHCYNLVHVCPKFCPDSCHVECASCKPICGPSSPGEDDGGYTPPTPTPTDPKPPAPVPPVSPPPPAPVPPVSPPPPATPTPYVPNPPSGDDDDKDDDDKGNGKGDDKGDGKGDDDDKDDGKGDDDDHKPSPPIMPTPPYPAPIDPMPPAPVPPVSPPPPSPTPVVPSPPNVTPTPYVPTPTPPVSPPPPTLTPSVPTPPGTPASPVPPYSPPATPTPTVPSPTPTPPLTPTPPDSTPSTPTPFVPTPPSSTPTPLGSTPATPTPSIPTPPSTTPTPPGSTPATPTPSVPTPPSTTPTVPTPYVPYPPVAPTPSIPTPPGSTPATPTPTPTPYVPTPPTVPVPSSPNSPPYVPPSSPTPTPPSDDEAGAGVRRARCKKKGSPCYGVEYTCHVACPRSCEVDCVTCKPLCKCDKPGSVCQDPRFIGGDGLTFYFHGKKDSNFCLISDPNLHINAHFIGKRRAGMARDFTWVQSIAILFGSHRFYVGALKTATWDDSVDRISTSFDGNVISLPQLDGATWTSSPGIYPMVSVKRVSADTNNLEVEVEGLLKITARVVPITMEDSRIHGYDVKEDDCLAHLDLGFKFQDLSDNVDGVIGQTYRPNYVSRVKIGVHMPVMGGDNEFRTSGLFAPDCSATRFIGNEGSNGDRSKMELPEMSCASGVGGKGVVCKR